VPIAVGGDGDDPAPLPAGREFAELDAGTIGIGQVDRPLAWRLRQGRHSGENERFPPFFMTPRSTLRQGTPGGGDRRKPDRDRLSARASRIRNLGPTHRGTCPKPEEAPAGGRRFAKGRETYLTDLPFSVTTPARRVRTCFCLTALLRAALGERPLKTARGHQNGVAVLRDPEEFTAAAELGVGRAPFRRRR
jgi:hypothetical protein